MQEKIDAIVRKYRAEKNKAVRSYLANPEKHFQKWVKNFEAAGVAKEKLRGLAFVMLNNDMNGADINLGERINVRHQHAKPFHLDSICNHDPVQAKRLVTYWAATVRETTIKKWTDFLDEIEAAKN